VVHDPRSDHGKTGNNVKVRVADRVLPRSGLKSNYDGGHFWGGAYSLDFGKPGVGRGPSLLVQRSRALLLDAQVAQKTAQQLALE